MSFFSLGFIAFICVIFVVYYALPAARRNLWLLIASYVFYALWDLRYTAVLLFITAISYLAGASLLRKRKKTTLFLSIALCLLVLIVFKFWRFWILGAQTLFGESEGLAGAAALVAPIGLSFYVLEAIGYMIDIYRGTSEPEKSFLRYALFLSFFPKVISGPIERSTHLLTRLRSEIEFDYDRVRHGLLTMLAGYFFKLMIADRAALLVNGAFDNYEAQTGMTMLIATVLYGIQLYMDFAGYSLIAIGMSETLGFDILQNFRQPYFAVSVRDFWSRWHISLSTWLRDYVYIPLGGNRKGKARKYLNLMITFLVSGLWHGTGMQFMVWGALHGVYQIVENVVHDFRKKTEIPGEASVASRPAATSSLPLRILKSIWIFILVDFAWLFFRAPSVAAGIEITRKMIFDLQGITTLSTGAYLTGSSSVRFIILLIELVGVLLFDILREKKTDLYGWLTSRHIVVRWTIYVGAALLLLLVLIRDFGAEASTFIYARF